MYLFCFFDYHNCRQSSNEQRKTIFKCHFFFFFLTGKVYFTIQELLAVSNVITTGISVPLIQLLLLLHGIVCNNHKTNKLQLFMGPINRAGWSCNITSLLMGELMHIVCIHILFEEGHPDWRDVQA
jgi:hypothetical protein